MPQAVRLLAAVDSCAGAHAAALTRRRASTALPRNLLTSESDRRREPRSAGQARPGPPCRETTKEDHDGPRTPNDACAEAGTTGSHRDRAPAEAATSADCLGGSFHGPRLTGTVLPGGGDWLLLDPLGNGHVDGRLTLRTSDGCHIYLQYRGIARATETVSAALAQGQRPRYGDMYYVVQPSSRPATNGTHGSTGSSPSPRAGWCPAGRSTRVFEARA